jgi:hypothetical protein
METIKRESVWLLLLDLCVIVAQIAAVFVEYAIHKLMYLLNISVVLALIVVIAPTIFFVVGYMWLKSKNRAWINGCLISALLLILNFFAVNIAAIYIGTAIQIWILDYRWS